jgi:hypothetical protein
VKGAGFQTHGLRKLEFKAWIISSASVFHKTLCRRVPLASNCLMIQVVVLLGAWQSSSLRFSREESGACSLGCVGIFHAQFMEKMSNHGDAGDIASIPARSVKMKPAKRGMDDFNENEFGFYALRRS